MRLASAKEQLRFARYLAKGEKIIVVTGISNLYFWSKFFQLLLLSLVIVGLPRLFKLLHRKRSMVYILTNRRFLILQGIFSRKLITAPLDAITHITVEQNFFERFFYNSGQLVIITAGYDPREIVIEQIADPVKFKVLIEELTTNLSKSEIDRINNDSAKLLKPFS
ncbi:MAG: PH domain-containing protein [Nitrososphaerota archaeon]